MNAPWVEQAHRDFSSFQIRRKQANDMFREHAIIYFGEADSGREWGVYIKPEWCLGDDQMEVRIDTWGYGRNGEKTIIVDLDPPVNGRISNMDHDAVERGINVVMLAFRAVQQQNEPVGLRLAA